MASRTPPVRGHARGVDGGALGDSTLGAQHAGAGAAPPFDVLMYNEAGEVTECALANVALQDAPGVATWSTPPIECGLLAGVMRGELLRRGMLRERVISVDELRRAVRAGRRLVAFNALRGVYEVELLLAAGKAKPADTQASRPRWPETACTPCPWVSTPCRL